jgi:hypothetical protein
MRTIKALVCAAALAAGLATSLAQSNVYSLNVVGYYNIPCAAQAYVLIANQLNTTNNTIAALLPNGPVSSTLLKWNGGWSAFVFDPDDLVWYPNGLATLNPGEGALFKCPTATTLTFVGEVEQGALSVTTPAGTYVVRSSVVPQAGLVSTDLGYPPEPSDTILKWNGGWSASVFDPDDLVFYPTQPTFGVGEGMMIKKTPASTIPAWVRNFTVQ